MLLHVTLLPMYNPEVSKKLKQGKIGVIPTDTVYGLVCSALTEDSVEKMYEIKERDQNKPFVYLISDVSDLEKLGVSLEEGLESLLSEFWPGPTSIIMNTQSTPEYIHRGLNSIAVRLPENESLQDLISKVGPLATTSANPEGEIPATNTEEARKYFGDSVDFYVNGKTLSNKSSRIIKLEDGKIEVIRD